MDRGGVYIPDWICTHFYDAYIGCFKNRTKHSFLLLPLNVFSTYYFQAIMKPNIAFVVSTGRGALVSGCLIQILPILWGASALWWAMPITEFVVAVFVLWKMMFCAKEFST